MCCPTSAVRVPWPFAGPAPAEVGQIPQPMFARRPPKRRQCTSGQDLMMQWIPPSSTTPQRQPRLAEATDTAQGIPANGMAHSCKQSPQKSTVCQSPRFDDTADSNKFHDPLQARAQPRLDVATDLIKVHSPRIPGKVTAPWPLAGPTPAKVGRRNGFQQVPRPMAATSSRQSMQRVGSISMSSNEFRRRVQARQQPRLDPATNYNEFHSHHMQDKLRLP